MRVAVIILAGGEGRRIGGGKPLKMFGGERLIDHALRHARGWSDAVAIAVREPAQVGPVDVQLILDKSEVTGPLAGLAAGLEFARADGFEMILTIPTDMPFLPKDLCPRLGQSIGSEQVAMACSQGQPHPVCALWRTSALGLLRAYLDSGRRSLRGLAADAGQVLVSWPAEPTDPFFNVNMAEDLCEAERRLRAN